MHILFAVFNDFTRFIKSLFINEQRHIRRSAVLGSFILLIIIVIIIYQRQSGESTTSVATTASSTSVTLQSVNALSKTTYINTIGTVEAVSEANLQTEVGGRVTSVPATIGHKVIVGQVIATLENSSQKAALLQTEGAYQAAQAGVAASHVGVNQAGTGLISALNGATTANRAAYTTVKNVVLNSIDQFYSNPTDGIIGVRINNDVDYLLTERLALRDILDTWQTTSAVKLTDTNADNTIDSASANVTRVIDIINALSTITSEAQNDDLLNGKALSTYNAQLLSDQAKLDMTITSLNTAKTSLAAARDAHQQAQINGSINQASSANAQLKIALGALRAAQSNYNRTIIRTPINGTINALYLKTGDYTSPGMPVARIANNQGLQIKAYVSETDSQYITIGDTVLISDQPKGVVGAKSTALDPTNGKIAVDVNLTDTTGITNGATVSLSFIASTSSNIAITIPLTALKLTSAGAIVFTITDSSTLVAIPVSIGAVSGDSVVITDGLSGNESLVVDARGLSDGQTVVTTNK